jgi:PAS domain S-box-containing protein
MAPANELDANGRDSSPASRRVGLSVAPVAEGLLRDQRELAAELARASSERRIASLCVDAVRRIGGVDVCGVYLAEPGSGDFVLADVDGASPEFIRAKGRFPGASPKLAALARRRVHHATEHDPPQDAVDEAIHDVTLVREGITALTIVSLLHRDRLLGCINVASRSLASFPEAVRDALETVAALVAEALARIEADRAIRDRAAEFEALVRASLDGYFALDAEGTVLDANDAFCRMVGYPLEWLRGQHIGALDVREERAITALLADMRARGWARFEARHRRSDGGFVDGEVSTWVVPGSGKILAFMRDLGEQRRAREALEEHELRYQSLLRGSMDGFVVVSADGQLVEVNEALCAMLGYSSEELRAMRVEDLDAASITPSAREDLRAILEGRQARYEATIGRRDGSELEIEISAWAVPGTGAIMAFARDISERRRAQEELARREAQLRQAQKMEAIGRLAGGVAHDFNNLLTVILSYTDLVAQGLAPGSDAAGDLEQVRVAAERAERLTQQLLAFSRKSIVRPETLEVGEVVRALEKMLRRLIGEDVDLRVEDRATRPVRIDRGHLEQVLMNLVVNARDAMPSGGRLAIDVRDLASAPEGGDPARAWLRLSVVDQGCGMDEATTAQIFEPFFTTKAPGRGTGLGLATVFGIVQQSGGQIRVRSALGAGTTFEIDLPCVERDADAPQGSREGAERTRGHERILIVEDEAGVRTLLKRVLTDAGFAVRVASNSREAERLAGDDASAFDLVLTDVVMPGMNGRELADRLRARRPDLRVLFMSGYAEQVLGQHGVVDDGVHLLAKPFSVGQVVQAVRRALDGHG